ncbi:hypothetical protein CPB86DRAFT_801802 [Serendipita vermifera]|nr:hypothetical protein CPB86DRAFT_801802 [Serendipita vermifera]
MPSLAGIALSRLAYDAQFTITQLDGFPGTGVSRPPTIHTLSEAHTIKDMIDAFDGIIDFDLTDDDNGYNIAFPIAATPEQREGIRKAKLYSYNHFHAWANWIGEYNDGKGKRDVYLLFVDWTPGQVAAKVGYGNLNSWGWSYNLIGSKSVILSEEEQQGAESWTAQDVYDKLVKLLLPPNNKRLELVGILRPEGSLPNLSASELGSMFNSVPVKWIQLTDISHGAAVVINREALVYHSEPDDEGPIEILLPTGITLANGIPITIVSANTYCPVECKLFFTNSKDNQTTATVKILHGTTPVNELTLKGLTPKLKGDARIKVMFEINQHGDASLGIEEVGGDNKVYKDFEDILIWDQAEIDAYAKETTNKQIDMVIGADGVVGELPL